MKNTYDVSKIESESLLNSPFTTIEIEEDQRFIHYGKKCFPLDGTVYTYTDEMKEQIIKEAGDYNVRSLPDIDADLQALKEKLKGLSIENGILNLKNESTGIIGIHLENLMKIDNNSNGTKGNMCLEILGADYLVKEQSISYIDVNDVGLDEIYDVQYTLNEEDKTCSVSKMNRSNKSYPTFNEDSIVRKKSSLDEYKIRSIETEAFEDQTQLNLKSLPKTITSIGDSAFYRCNNLSLEKLPPKLTEIQSNAFVLCYNLAISSLPSTITYIGKSAFDNCKRITISELPPKCTILTENMFSGCENITLSSIPSGILKIPNGTFSGCSKISLEKLPPTITEIGNNSFASCQSMTLKELPETITKIGIGAFQECTLLALTKLPDKWTEITEMLFTNCSSLALTNLPQETTKIGAFAFQDCISLVTIKIPSKVTLIESCAFERCTKLNIFDCTELSTLTIDANAFRNCASCILKMTQSLADFLGSRIINNKIDDATVEIVEPEEIL